jgi:hypothetical protein
MFLLTHKKVKKVINNQNTKNNNSYANSRSNSDVSFMSIKSNLSKNELNLKNRTYSRRYSRKVNIFFNNLKSQTICHQKIENFENSINEGIEIIEEELENQILAFQEKLKIKRKFNPLARGSFSSSKNCRTPNKNTPRHSSINLENGKKNSSQNLNLSLFNNINNNTPRQSRVSIKPFIINQNDKFYPVIQEFFKKFQILYLKLIFEKAIDFTKNTYTEIYSKKIEKFLRYQDDIKNYEMFKLMEEDENTKQSLMLLIKSLELDRETEILKYNDMTSRIFERFIDKGMELKLSGCENFRDLIEETMVNLLKKFQ